MKKVGFDYAMKLDIQDILNVACDDGAKLNDSLEEWFYDECDNKTNDAMTELMDEIAGDLEYKGSRESLERMWGHWSDAITLDLIPPGWGTYPFSTIDGTSKINLHFTVDVDMDMVNERCKEIDFSKEYYGLTQWVHGSEKRLIVSKEEFENEIIPKYRDETSGLIEGFPFGGINTTPTFSTVLTNEESARKFLTANYAFYDKENIYLADIAAGYVEILDQGDTSYFLKALDINNKKVVEENAGGNLIKLEKEVLECAKALKLLDYKDFDYDDVFHNDMRLSDLEELVTTEKVKYLDSLGLNSKASMLSKDGTPIKEQESPDIETLCNNSTEMIKVKNNDLGR